MSSTDRSGVRRWLTVAAIVLVIITLLALVLLHAGGGGTVAGHRPLPHGSGGTP